MENQINVTKLQNKTIIIVHSQQRELHDLLIFRTNV